jgi:sec-independent protein translocase protein TatA
MFGLGYQELLIILVIVLILFGANRLPELARSLGSSVKEFKKGVNEAKAEAEDTPPVHKEEEKKA